MMKMQNGGQFNYAEKINGVLPDIHTLGDKESSQRAVEIKKLGINTNTCCSLSMLKDGNQRSYKQVTVGNTSSVISTKVNENKSQTQSFHLPSDVGYVVVNSLQAVTGLSDLSISNIKPYTPKLSSGAITTTATTATATSEMAEKPSYLPNALLITHAHDDHIHDLSLLLENIRRLSNDATFEI